MKRAHFGLNSMGFSITECKHEKEYFEPRFKAEGTQQWSPAYRKLHISIDKALCPVAEECAGAGIILKFGCEEDPTGYAQVALFEIIKAKEFVQIAGGYSEPQVEKLFLALEDIAKNPEESSAEDIQFGSWYLNICWIPIGFPQPSRHVVIWFPNGDLDQIWGRLTRWNRDAV
jgi:hypothetical protein